MNHTFKYCDFTNFSKSYLEIHGPLSFLVCIFGSIANILNICVLTTKEMRWPTNFILTGLAVADLLVMLEYIPFNVYAYLDTDGKKYISHYSYNWALFTVFHAAFSQIFHFISCCLTVLLAIWRYIIITNPHNTNNYCSVKRTLSVILLCYILCPVICSPIFLTLKIKSYNHTCDSNGKLIDKPFVHLHNNTEKRVMYHADIDPTYHQASFWVYGVVLKLVPCILLTHLSRRIISVLIETQKRRMLLLSGNLPVNNFTEMRPVLSRKFQKDRQTDRTSGMLVAVLLLFLLTEFPQAILGLLSATEGSEFQKECYMPLGELMDILALTNSAINFILYCTMSRQFRATFQEVFRPRILVQWISLTQYSTADANGEKTQFSTV